MGRQQYLTRANNPGGNDPDSSSSDTDIDDFPNRNPRQPNDGNGGGDRRGNGLGIVQRRREERQNAIQINLKKQLEIIIRDFNRIRKEGSSLPICKFEDILDLIKECKITVEKADKNNIRINEGNIIPYIDHKGRRKGIDPDAIDTDFLNPVKSKV